MFRILIALMTCGVVAAEWSRSDYVPDTSAFANPERGWYVQEENTVSASWLREQRKNYGSTLLRLYVRLDPWKNGGAVSDSAMQSLHRVLGVVRENGYKVILRFAYNFGDAADASLEVILEHIRQLKPLLKSNADVISVMEAGFVGYWGEWHSSMHGLTYEWNSPDSLKRYSKVARARIVDSLLNAYPGFILIRYPRAIYEIFGDRWPDFRLAYGTQSSRIGHHNDCFVASLDHWGTYTCTDWRSNACWAVDTSEVNWLARNSRFMPVEGETCNNDPVYSACDTALKYLRDHRWDALHRHYHEGVVNRWITEGCYSRIQRHLGYRLEIRKASVTQRANRGDSLRVELVLANTGWGKMYNPRPFELWLRGRRTGSLLKLNSASWNADTGLADIRCLGPGDSLTWRFTGGILPSVPLDTYDLVLRLPDRHSHLQEDPRYSVRLANMALWDSLSGENRLGIYTRVDGVSAQQAYRGSWWWAQAGDSLPSFAMSPKRKIYADTRGLYWVGRLGKRWNLLGRRSY